MMYSAISTLRGNLVSNYQNKHYITKESGKWKYMVLNFHFYEASQYYFQNDFFKQPGLFWANVTSMWNTPKRGI